MPQGHVGAHLPYWQSDITPALEKGKTVLVAAHGNSIRGILKY